MTRIREYRLEDYELVKSFVESIQDYMVSIDPIKRVRRLAAFGKVNTDELLGTIKDQGGKIYICENDSEPLGFVAGFLTKQSEQNKLAVIESKLGYVAKLYVAESSRGKGVGKKLMLAIEQYFIDEGCDSIWVDVDAYNETAHETYKQIGYIDREIGMLKKI